MLLVLDDIGYYHLYCFKGLFVKSRTLTFFIISMVWCGYLCFLFLAVFFLCPRNFWKFGQGFPSYRAFPGPGLYKYRVIARRLFLLVFEPGIKGLMLVSILHIGFKATQSVCLAA